LCLWTGTGCNPPPDEEDTIFWVIVLILGQRSPGYNECPAHLQYSWNSLIIPDGILEGRGTSDYQEDLEWMTALIAFIMTVVSIVLWG